MGRNLTFAPGEFYHIYNRGTDKRNIFPETSDSLRFLSLLYLCNNSRKIHLSDYIGMWFEDLLKIPRGNTLVDIGAYCLMPNHFHILLREKTEDGISSFIQKLSTAYTMYFNKKYERSGALFEGRFRAKHIDNDIYLKYLFSYIHLNPVKILDPEWKENGISNLTKAKEFLNEYSYSSFLDYAVSHKRKEAVLINKEAFPEYFQTTRDFEREIDDWLLYRTVKVQP